MYRIHQKGISYNFKFKPLKCSRTKIEEIKKRWMSVPFFCGNALDHKEIVDYFFTFVDVASEHAAPEVRGS